MISALPRHRQHLVRAWIAIVALVYLGLAASAIYTVDNEKQLAKRNHTLRMDPDGVEPGRTQADPLPANANFTPVHLGVYLEGIEALSIRDSYWIATFYIWFRWRGDKKLDPGSTFRLVDARIENKEPMNSYSAANGEHYQSYKVVARLTKFFNTTRVPLDDHMLNIYIEDAVRDVNALRYVADPATNVSSRVQVPGYMLTGTRQVVKAHTYKTDYGDSRMVGDRRTTHSEYIFAVSVQRAGVGTYIKLFIGLFAGVLITIGSFFIRPADTGPRFGLPSAAYFGVVANTYLVNSTLPPSGVFGLTDYVTGVGLITIFLCVVVSIVSAHFYLKLDEKGVSRELDWVASIGIGTGFLVVNIVLPVCALS